MGQGYPLREGALSRRVAALAFASAVACSPVSEAAQVAGLEGYGSLELGMSLEAALAVAPAHFFNPAGVSDCLADMHISGCFLPPADEMATFERVDGIPYGLQLEFNRRGALTDITLRFDRRTRYDTDGRTPATITKAECRDISARTVDWVAAEYGRFQGTRLKEPSPAHTAKGNPYWIQTSPRDDGFTAIAERSFAAGRKVALFAYFMLIDGEPNCHVALSFEEAASVERRMG